MNVIIPKERRREMLKFAFDKPLLQLAAQSPQLLPLFQLPQHSYTF